MARTGKIARLPAAIRTELNHRLRDGQSGTVILPWLNALPETQAVLAADFHGSPINAQNLSDWRQGGYADWEGAQDRLLHTRALAEQAAALAREAGGTLNEGAAAILSGRILEVLEALGPESTPESLAGIIKSVALLRSGDQDQLRIAQKREELSLARQKFQRETCELFLQWSADQAAMDAARSDGTNTEKIEKLGRLMFGDTWLPAAPAAP